MSEYEKAKKEDLIFNYKSNNDNVDQFYGNIICNVTNEFPDGIVCFDIIIPKDDVDFFQRVLKVDIDADVIEEQPLFVYGESDGKDIVIINNFIVDQPTSIIFALSRFMMAIIYIKHLHNDQVGGKFVMDDYIEVIDVLSLKLMGIDICVEFFQWLCDNGYEYQERIKYVQKQYMLISVSKI